MADGDSTDLLMVVKPKGADPLAGEARARFDKSDNMMLGFTSNNGINLFAEAEEFTFGAGVEDDAEPMEKAVERLAEQMQSGGGTWSAQTTKDGQPVKPKSGGKRVKYKRFFQGGASGPNGLGYDVVLDDVTITRRMDQMSVKLLELCLQQREIENIILVKRKAVGGQREYNQQPFLRIQFSGVLITAIDWDDGDVIKEKLKFVYRSVTSSFKVQNDDGTLGGAIGATVTYNESNPQQNKGKGG